jgi:hypothetical protein
LIVGNAIDCEPIFGKKIECKLIVGEAIIDVAPPIDEAVRLLKVDHTSMSYIYKVFEHLLLLCIGI